MQRRPVLYLDLDDTVISWDGGHPHGAPGATEFMEWALSRFEVRWLTTWCPGGEMEEGLLHDLCKMLRLPPERLEQVRGFDWEGGGSKVNGIAWLEHLVLGRPFAWLEDPLGFGEREREFLAAHGLLDRYYCCNVTNDPASLQVAKRALAERFASADERAAA